MAIRDVQLDRGVALAHSDPRRDIYDPVKILDGLEGFGNWQAHNIIVLSEDKLELGNHHHPYSEAFYTPTGGFQIALADSTGNVEVYDLTKDSRIVIPLSVDHLVLGSKGGVLLGYGTAEFSPEYLVSATNDSQERMRSVLK